MNINLVKNIPRKQVPRKSLRVGISSPTLKDLKAKRDQNAFDYRDQGDEGNQSSRQ